MWIALAALGGFVLGVGAVIGFAWWACWEKNKHFFRSRKYPPECPEHPHSNH